MAITNGKLLAESLSTLFYSWSSGPYPEVYWAYTEMLKWINTECGTNFEDLGSEEMDDDACDRVNEVIAYLESDECNNLKES